MRLRNPIAIAGAQVEPWQIALPVLAVGLGALAYGVSQVVLTNGEASLPPSVVPPARFKGVPFAFGIDRPLWPVISRNRNAGKVSYKDVDGDYHGNWARRFGAPRGDTRYHVGMDLYANAGDPVIAMADGLVTAVQSFHLGSWAMFVDHGPVTVMYAEIEKNSWRGYGARVGNRVRKGHQIARVACMRWEGNRCESHMLHLETYRPGTTRNKRWYRGNPAPNAVLDPTWLILQAKGMA